MTAHRIFILLLGLPVLCLSVSSQVFAEEDVSASTEETASNEFLIVKVEGESIAEEHETLLDPEQANYGLSSDGGEILRSVPGVSGVRMGGRGIDPVIRGQQANRLNVLMDGAYIHGGCPNRMDPPTAYAPTTSFDEIRVIKGNQTLQYGEGGSGGTVVFERTTPRFTDSKSYRAKASSAYNSNGDAKFFDANVIAGGEKGYFRINAGHNEANHYKDGNGNSVLSGYEASDVDFGLGFTPNENLSTEIGWSYLDEKDVFYGGARMDSPESESMIYRLHTEWNDESGTLRSVRFNTYFSPVDHVMDNFSLRSPAMGMPRLVVNSDSDTYGGRLLFDIASTDSLLHTLGLDLQNNSRESLRYMSPADGSTNMLQSVLWPDVDLNKFGFFLETEAELGTDSRLKVGARYDHIDYSAGRADLKPAGMNLSPNMLYSTYYNQSAGDDQEHNVGGLARFEQDLWDEKNLIYFALSRTLRTADTTERFMAANGMQPAMRWVGNPGLDPEEHHQAEIGTKIGTDQYGVDFSLFYNNVSNFILRDRAHAQNGIFQNDNATIYRNVDATLLGGELAANLNITSELIATGSLAYTYAENDSDNRAIAQIPPLEADLGLEFRQSGWLIGSRLEMAAQQNRVDDNPATGSGLDARKTPGYALLNLYGEVELGDIVRLQLGVDNLFDKNYAQHLNKPNAFDAVQIQVNEPGRAFWVRLVADI